MYDRGDYKYNLFLLQSFALRAIEIKSKFSHNKAQLISHVITTPQNISVLSNYFSVLSFFILIDCFH